MIRERDGILFVCESMGSLNIALRIANQFNFQCPLYLFTLENLLSKSDEPCASFDFVTTDHNTIPGLLQYIKLVLLGAHESTPHCRISNCIGFLCKKTNTAHASIQHGWIQPGHNFFSSIKRVSYRGFETDNSRSLSQFSEIFSFFGKNGIGYPYPNQLAEKKPNDSINNIIIATNFNWGIYSKPQIVEFINVVKEIRRKFPSSNIVHRPHPAEKAEKISSDWGDTYADLNIKCTRDNLECLDIKWPELVISTPSTVALDYITANVPTALYAPEIFESYVKELSLDTNSFAYAHEAMSAIEQALRNNNCNIPRFPSEKFAKMIENLVEEKKDFFLDEKIFLQFCDFLKN